MRWLRRRKPVGAYAAAFGLLIQLIASFGHVHLEGVQPQAAAIAEAGNLTEGSDGTPTDGNSHEHPGDVCDICAALSLAAAAQVAAPPALLVRFAVGVSAKPVLGETKPVAARRVELRNRAPPSI